MAEKFLYFTELLGLPVYDLKHRRIGRVRDAALVPLVHPSRVDRFLVGAGSSWFSVRYDQISADLARRHPAQRRKTLPLSLRRVHAAHRARSARPADHRCQRPQSRARQRRHPRSAARPGFDQIYRARSGYRDPQHSAPPPAGRRAAPADPRGCSSRSRPTPSAGISATSSKPTRSAACASTSRTTSWN